LFVRGSKLMINISKKTQRTYASVLFFFLFVSSSVSAADQSLLRINKAVHNLQIKAAGNISVSRGHKSPYISFLRAYPGTPLSDLSVISRFPGDRAQNFLQMYKNAFTNLNSLLDLETMHVETDNGISTVRLQQMFNGLVVRGADVVVQMNPMGITVVNSKLKFVNEGFDIQPIVTELDAKIKADQVIQNLYGIEGITISELRLEILDIGIFTGVVKIPKLAWFIEATNSYIDEYIWIDARTGQLIKNISQVARLHINRNVRDAGGLADTCLFNNAVEVRIEGGAVTGSADVDSVYDLTGLTYTYYLDVLGRHGLKDIINTDASIFSIVNVCNTLSPQFDPPTDLAIPLTLTVERAALNGALMLYAPGYVVDDVVGHEYTHRVITESAKFLLDRETGALAESFADIFGEAIDLATPDLAADKWKIGEDAPEAKAFRNLLTPGDSANNEDGVVYPTRVTDANYYCGPDNDVYIHKNSTVLSHAFALAVEGVDINLNLIVPNAKVDLNKAAKVYYNALKLLSSTSKFIEAYNAIIAAATTAVGLAEITSADKTNIINALDAVEMNIIPCVTPKIPYCPTGQIAQFAFQDDFENINTGNWSTSVISGVNHWNGGLGTAPSDVYQTGTDPIALVELARQGNNALYANGSRRLGGSEVSMNNTVSVGADYRIQFEHNFAFENTEADGGYIEYSANGGPWLDAGPLIVSGVAYTPGKTISSVAIPPNPLAGHAGFLNFMREDAMFNPLYDYRSTQLDLNLISPALVSIRFRFVVGTDNQTDARGWVIDEFAIYTCIPQVFKVNQGSLALTTNESGKAADFSVTLETQPVDTVTINLSSSLQTEGIVTFPANKTLTFTPANWNIPQNVTVTGQDDSVVDGDIAYVVQLVGTATDTLDSKFNVTVDVSITNGDDGEVTRSGGGGGGGGGCSVSTDSDFDPGLPLMVLLSLLYLYRKRKTRGQ